MKLVLAFTLLAAPAFAQDYAEAPGAKLRILDKLTGAVSDVVLSDGQSQVEGQLTVQLDSCRYPADNATAEAFAHLTILTQGADAPAFNGWMVASSPALSALDHPRYDVWVLRCDVPDLVLPEVEPEPEAVEDPNATAEGDGQ